MKSSFLSQLICPACWHLRQTAQPLQTTQFDSQTEQGMLRCAFCSSRFPILDGVPVLLPQVQEYLQQHLHELTQRDDLSPEMEALLAESCGVQSAFEYQRLYLSHYAWDHYGEFAPQESAPSGCVALTERLLEMAACEPAGPLLDLGCATGRTTFHLAQRFGQPTFGVDINFALLRVAAQVCREGMVRFSRRRLGMLYERWEYPVPVPERERGQFLAGDGQALPFATNTFAAVLCLNLLDCVPDPRALLAEIRRVLKPEGQLLLGSPYDWSAQTPLPNWLGGESQGGNSEAVLRSILTPASGLELQQEAPRVPWRLRLHDRSTIEYQVHLMVARKTWPE